MDEISQRFLREIKLQASTFYHPNVHWPFSVQLIGRTPVAFFRMWRDDLSSEIENTEFEIIGRLSVIAQIVTGLKHCLSCDVILQDIKPENVFLKDLCSIAPLGIRRDLTLVPLIGDFGSANLHRDCGVFEGSRPYMSPEQWSSSPITEKSTVFSVGIMLYELITLGFHPIGEHGGEWHRGENPGFNRWQNNKKWRQWMESSCKVADRGIDDDLESILERCLQFEPTKRPTLDQLCVLVKEAIAARSDSAIAQVELLMQEWQKNSSKDRFTIMMEEISQVERQLANIRH